MNNSRYKTISQFFGREPVVLAVYIVITLLASIQQYLLPEQIIGTSKLPVSNYNNYVIFKNSFFHLLANRNLYTFYLTEQWDLFKYSPTFALFMGLFAFLPNWLGLTLWNALNTLVLFFGIKHLPHLSRSTTVKIRWFVLIELLTSIQNSQSNGLILGLFIWSFIYLERGNLVWATLFILFSIFIKVFGIVGFVLFLVYPRKLAAFSYTSLWTVLLVILPLIVVSYQQLFDQYQNWVVLLQNDHSSSIGLSVMGWLNTWFSLVPSKGIVVVIGCVLLLLPLLRVAQYQYYHYRLLILASILIWVVIFNHKAESPTFIIAIGGVGLWYFSQPSTITNKVLVILAFVFTSLSSTDVFPTAVREMIVLPYVLKAVFCIAIWVKITVDLVTIDWETTTLKRLNVSLKS
ncbi:glycosyltransferase family 87 protein [Spirosoma flavum]|uniref:Glycosyltransferase family 87 protein n=1 Tax=Spirosoma flavum TaxID=2048557 RepID=A0ABW6APN9_9BACT